MTNATDFDSISELRDNARAILQMPGFAEWQRQIEAQIQLRQAALLGPLKSHDETLEQEYKKGEVAGLMHAVMHWNLMVEALTQEIVERNAEQDGE